MTASGENNVSKRRSLTNKQKRKNVASKKFPWESLIRSIFVGYIFGLSLTMLWFLYNYETWPVLQSKSTFMLLIFLLMFGGLLAWSRNVRCTSTLILPILFSSKGRSLLITCALVLAATGPTINILANVDVLIKSMSCGQEQLKIALEKMLDVVKRPLIAVKNAINVAMSEIKKVLKRVEEVLIKIRNLVSDILNAIKKAFDWLGSVVSMCNKKLGTPFDRCIKIADEAMEDCKQKLGDMGALCNVTDVFRALCYSVKFIDAICVLVDFVSDSIIQKAAERLDQFSKDIKTMFYVSVKFDQEFHFKTTATKNLTEVGGDILTEIQNQMRGFFILFGWMEIVGSFMVFLVIIKALIYKRKYLRNDGYDNHFITKDFMSINEERERLGKDVVLPLTQKERKKYVMITSAKLVRAELLQMSRSLLFLAITTVQLLCICLTDYSLYWLLSTILFYGTQEAGLEIPPFMTVNVSGGGFTADVLKGIVHVFEPMAEKYEIDPRPCLPRPIVPKFSRYWQIGIFIGVAWLFVFLQPYGLRLRQVIMRVYYPARSKQRALWLYNDILLKRESFIKFARRQARGKFLKDKSADDYSFLDWLRAKTNRFWIFRKVLGSGNVKSCNICGIPLKDVENAIECQQVGCPGMYCGQCYAELNNTCCLCQNPIDYGDLSDVSEEKDSSDELEGIHVVEDDFCSQNP